MSALSTAEAELCAAALAWQVAEGVRYLLGTLGIYPARLTVFIDNKAALTAASLGATWRTRYYAVRARRLLEESRRQRLVIEHCPTLEMVADTLTKLATPEVIEGLRAAMNGFFPRNRQRISQQPVAKLSQQHKKDKKVKEVLASGVASSDAPLAQAEPVLPLRRPKRAAEEETRGVAAGGRRRRPVARES